MKRIINLPNNVVEAIQNGEDYRYDIHTAIAQSIPYNPTDDCISREQVLKELMAHQYSQDFCKEHGIEYSINSSMVRIVVRECPPVELDTSEIEYNAYCRGLKHGKKLARPVGEWINHRNDYGHNIADCSLCGKAMQWHDEDEDGIPRYCWYCGASMKGDVK